MDGLIIFEKRREYTLICKFLNLELCMNIYFLNNDIFYFCIFNDVTLRCKRDEFDTSRLGKLLTGTGNSLPCKSLRILLMQLTKTINNILRKINKIIFLNFLFNHAVKTWSDDLEILVWPNVSAWCRKLTNHLKKIERANNWPA